MAPIPGARRRAHLEENAAAAVIELAEHEARDLDAACPVGAAAGLRYMETNLRLLGW